MPQFFGWGGVVWYGGDTNMVYCPEEGHANSWDSNKPGFTDFWINANLNQALPAACANPSKTLLFGDGNDGTDKTDGSYSLAKFPTSWLTSPSSPMVRHRGAGNYVFVDGSSRRLYPSDAVHFGSRTDPFALK